MKHVTARINIDYPVTLFDNHALHATRGSSRSPSSLLTSMKLLDADARKLDLLVRLRSTKTAFMHQTTRFEVTKSLTRDYLLWTTDLCLVPGVVVDWSKLVTTKYALHLAIWLRPKKPEYLFSKGCCVNMADNYGRWYCPNSQILSRRDKR